MKFQLASVRSRRCVCRFVRAWSQLLIERLVFQLKKRAYYNNKPQLRATVKFIAHFSGPTIVPLHYSARDAPGEPWSIDLHSLNYKFIEKLLRNASCHNSLRFVGGLKPIKYVMWPNFLHICLEPMVRFGMFWPICLL